MRKLLFLILLLITVVNLNGQTIKWSPQLADNKKLGFLKILGSDENDRIYVLKSNFSFNTDRDRNAFKNRMYVLQLFSPELRLVWEKEIKPMYEEARISDLKMVGNKVLVMMFRADKKTSAISFAAQYIGQDGNWLGSAIELDRFNADEIDDDNRPGLILSQNEELIAFSYRQIPDSKQTQVFTVSVADTSLNVLYKKSIDIQVPFKLFVPLNFNLTNQGSFFVLGVRYLTDKKVKEPGQMFYEVFGYNRTNDQIIHSIVKSEDKFLTDVGFTMDNLNRHVVVAGFYSDRTTYSTAGVFYYALSEDSLLEKKIVSTPFSSAYLQKFIGERKDNKTNELTNYSIDRLMLRRDGGVGLMAESYYNTYRSYFDYYMQMYIENIYYHYGSIMLISVNPNGNILWNNIIAKDQNSTNDGGYYSSYCSGVSSGKLFAIYNKYIQDNASVLLTTVDGVGNQKTDILFNESDRVTIIPRAAKQVDEETVVMPALKQNRLYLLKVTF